MGNLKHLLLLCLIFTCIINADRSNYFEDMASRPMYYDPKSRTAYRMTSVRNNLSGSMDGEQYLTKAADTYRIFGYRANGCSCQGSGCNCCAGFNIPQFNFNQEGCMDLSYDPYAFAINMNMIFNNNSVYTNSLSAKNPPPLCIPVPIPYIPGVDFCVKLFDIHMPGQNLHMCLDFETRIQRATILVLHFDCMRMGSDGVSLLKPGQEPSRPVTIPAPTVTDPPAVDSDIYDPLINENKYRIATSKAH